MEMFIPPHYDMLEELGRGSTGIVFKVRDEQIGRVHALKILIPMPGPEATVRAHRFMREAHAMAACNHPNIVQVHAVGEINGQCFIVREFVDGRTLQAELNKELFTDRQACKMVELLTRPVQHIHDKGMIHRKLTPDNVLIAHDGAVKLIGFGNARAIDGMSPASVSIDIQDLGVMLYHLMTRSRLPEKLAKICRRCSNVEPKDQYQSVKDLGEDLRRHLRGNR